MLNMKEMLDKKMNIGKSDTNLTQINPTPKISVDRGIINMLNHN